MRIQEIYQRIQIPGGHLACTIIKPHSNQKLPAIVMLPGSQGTKERYHSIQKHFVDQSYFTLSLDFRGRGESSGEPLKNSLTDQFYDVKYVFNFLQTNQSVNLQNLTLIGTSMGAFIAASISDELPVKNLILSSPAVYLPQHEHLPLSQLKGRAKEIIASHPNSFTDAKVFSHLNRFTGNALVIEHEKDQIIPPKVCQAYLRACTQAENKEYLILNGVEHSFLQEEKWKQALAQVVDRWLKSLK